MDNIKEIKELNKELKALNGEKIKKIYWDENNSADQYLNIITEKKNIRFGCNDCGIWKS